MKENLEFEIKAEINPINEKLSKFILQLPEAVENAIVNDIYYDTPKFDLYKNGVFVRVRNNIHFEIKYDTDQFLTHTKTKDFKFKLPLSTLDLNHISLFLRKYIKDISVNNKSIFSKFGLTELVKIEKKRKVYIVDKLIISIDDVSGLGKFIEIEGSTSNEFTEIKKIASSLNLVNMEVGYVELMLRLQNFEAYKLGRYKLKKDKSC